MKYLVEYIAMCSFETTLVILCVAVLVLSVGPVSSLRAEDVPNPSSPYAKWKNGPSTDPNFFPIGVSTQDPSLAADFKEIGINMFVRLWDGPTGQQLDSLRACGMQTVCNQNEFGLKSNDKDIIAWTLEDEPDIAKPMAHTWKNDREKIKQAWPELGVKEIAAMDRYGPPIPAAWILEDYKKFSRLDSTRPVRLNLSMAVAYPEYKGRSIRSGHDEDYITYARACDIISFDIYPYNDPKQEVRGKLYLQAVGLNKLKELTDGKKPIWNYIETTKIFKNGRKPPKEIIRSQVWISLINGSKGIIYFCHGIHPETGSFWDKSLYSDKEQMQNLKQINAEVLSLAPVLNSPEQKNAVMVRSQVKPSRDASSKGIGVVSTSAYKYDGYMYVFAARMEDSPAEMTFTLRRSVDDSAEVEVIGENRTIRMDGRAFKDDFAGFGVHLYRGKLD